METWQISAILGDHRLPIGADPLVIAATFIGALVIFYFVLIRLSSLSKIGWKKVDFVWLALSVLGIYGAVQSVRIDFARDKVALYQADADRSWSRLLLEADDVASHTGPVCQMRAEVLSTLPEARRADVIDQFNMECALLQSYAAMLHRRREPSKEEFLTILEPPLPSDAAPELEKEIAALGNAWYRVESSSAFVRGLETVSQRSSTERFLFGLSPFAIAIAIALRLIKTIAEIRLERTGSIDQCKQPAAEHHRISIDRKLPST